jgi:periplasmic protein TonB
MRREVTIAFLVSIALHGAIAGSSYFLKKPAPPLAVDPAVPTIEINLPPPEPEEPLPAEATVADDAPSAESIAPTLMDTPSAVIDPGAFVQKLTPPPPPGIDRPTAISALPSTRLGTVGGGLSGALGEIFDLKSLDRPLEPRFRPPPQYPGDMKRSSIEGQVVVELVINAEGRVVSAKVISSTNPGFDDAAIAGVMRWTFKPPTVGGRAVSAKARAPIPFTLRGND